ncbi:MAG: sigma-70 family RNA polymerase sigma factor [Actinomycetia bacterium]|nr:sigma-70 family RNA polymerase sigma factor [Actinomycetes bacterium]
MEDAEFVASPRYENGEWLGELFSRYEAKLMGCAHRMLSQSEVEDAAQEINERILKGLPTFRGDSAVGTWIFAVARNTCLDIRRRRRPIAYDSADILENIPSGEQPADLFDISILGCRTALAVRDLPEGQAAVLMLRLGQGLSTADTASQLGITQDSVKAKLRRARQRLTSSLTEEVACPQCGPGTYSISGIRIDD